MADEPMLGLFDGESNFLDELTSSGSADMQPSMPQSMQGAGMMPQHMQQQAQTPQG